MLVATAGHIDHGKTALVRALSGVETDRLPEEKARGISIDLGFAYWTPDGEATIGFIDVPGHERFVRNMLAGVAAIDFAMLVVAADDGVMQQTVEHLQILDLLGVSRGIVVITKTDRATPERVGEVRSAVARLVRGTLLADAAIFGAAAPLGLGIPDIATALRTAARWQAVPGAYPRNFRMAIDRVFSVTGVGTVVTGTVQDSVLESGALLVVGPAGRDVRVRGMQVAGHKVHRAEPGQRCAVNLVGVEVAEVHRGDWLVVPAMNAQTDRLDVELRVLGGRETGLKHHSPVHLHIGTADIAARVLTARQATIAPGTSAVAQLVLEQPTMAVSGDRFVIRDQSGQQSIGGGAVVDPFPPADRRRGGSRAEVIVAMRAAEPADALRALLGVAGHEPDAQQVERTYNLIPNAAAELYRDLGAVMVGKMRPVLLSSQRAAAIKQDTLSALDAFHRANPDADGLSPRALREGLSQRISADAYTSLLRELAEAREVEATSFLVKRAGHTASFSDAERALWDQLGPWFEQRGLASFTHREVAAELRTTEGATNVLLYRRRAHGDIWRITNDRYLSRDQIAALAATAALLSEQASDQGFSAADYRNAIGTGRTLAIHILEFFDGIGVTSRRDNIRRIKANYEDVVGRAPPYRPAVAAGDAT